MSPSLKTLELSVSSGDAVRAFSQLDADRAYFLLDADRAYFLLDAALLTAPFDALDQAMKMQE